MNARFYAPDAHASGDVVALPDEEAQHLTRVLRLKPGDAVRVFNGRGGEFHGTVGAAGRRVVEIAIGEACVAAAEPRVAVTLAQAVLKGDKMDDVVRDAVMMGVTAVQPILTARTEVARASLERAHRRDRWQRVAISSAKQCGRAVVPEVFAPVSFDELRQAIGALRLPAPALMLVEPHASAETCGLGELDPLPPREATVVVGPEGGWTPDEITAGAEACRLLTIGGRTLRADAMAIAVVAALFARWGEF